MDCKACGKGIEGKNYVTGENRNDVFHPDCDPDREQEVLVPKRNVFAFQPQN